MSRRFGNYLPWVIFGLLVLVAVGYKVSMRAEQGSEVISPSSISVAASAEPLMSDKPAAVSDIKISYIENSPYIEKEVAKDSGKGYEINVEYPQLKGLSNKEVQDRLNKKFIPNLNEIRSRILGMKQLNEVKAVGVASAKNSYAIGYVSSRLVSIAFIKIEYDGISAHEFMNADTKTYDLTNGDEIQLNDLLLQKPYYDKLLSYIKSVLKKRFPTLAGHEDFYNKLKAEDLHHFVVTGDGLAFIFDPYKVALFADGFQEVVVPYSELKDILNPVGILNEIIEKTTNQSDASVLLDKNRPAKFRSAEARNIKSALPSQSFLRDYAALQNAKGYLVLYVNKPEVDFFPGNDENGDGVITIAEHDSSCFSDNYGQQLRGDYYLGLVRAGKLINSVPLPLPYYEPNRPVFRQLRGILEGTYYDHPAPSDNEIVEPPILNLEDLTGDGLANEVSFRVGYVSCGHNDYAIGGYDPILDQSIIFTVHEGSASKKTYGNFHPDSNGSVDYNSGCDHGAGQEDQKKFVFDAKQNAYIMQSAKTVTCEY